MYTIALRAYERRVKPRGSGRVATLLRDDDADGVAAPLTGRRSGLQRCGHDRGIYGAVGNAQ